MSLTNEVKNLMESIEAEEENLEEGGSPQYKYNILENLISALSDALWKLQYLESDIINGILAVDKRDEKYQVVWEKDGESRTLKLSCNSSLEIRNPIQTNPDELWLIGRVEYSEPDGYYFKRGNKDYPLCDGMQVRKRQE